MTDKHATYTFIPEPNKERMREQQFAVSKIHNDLLKLVEYSLQTLETKFNVSVYYDAEKQELIFYDAVAYIHQLPKLKAPDLLNLPRQVGVLFKYLEQLKSDTFVTLVNEDGFAYKQAILE